MIKICKALNKLPEIEVKTYDSEGKALAYALSNEFHSESDIVLKNHFIYFLEFFGDPQKQKNYGHNAKIIVIENKYTSKSYLDDFQGHYVLAHRDYLKTCKRVHFFNYNFESEGKSDFAYKDFEEEYINFDKHNESKFWKSYLGYIVIRPLPKGLIGATVLLGYTNDLKRKYSSTREYKVNLWGIEKKIDSMVYLEQDSVIGACATSALFSAFHKVSHMFQTLLPYPNKITISAGMSYFEPGRILPNRDGLDIGQMVKAIDSIGLVSEIRSPKFVNRDNNYNFHNDWTKAYLYAYCKMGIPIVLGLEMHNDNSGIHAITVNGYYDIDNNEIQEKLTNRYEGNNLLKKIINRNVKPVVGFPTLKSSLIERFYAHDDQIGPFSRLGFEEENTIISSWWNKENPTQKIRSNVYAIIVPLENIIRIHFGLVLDKIAIIEFWLKLKFKLSSRDVYWDIYLDYSNEYKKQLVEAKRFELHSEILFDTLPKYIWIAKCYMGENTFDILFDSAEINENFFAIHITFHNSTFKEKLKGLLEKINISNVDEELWNIDLNHLNLFNEACSLQSIKRG